MKLKGNYQVRSLFITIFSIALATVACGKTIYVDDDAPGANDGSSWENAYTYLQYALADAETAVKPVEIRVAQGTYRPDMGAGQTPGDREATFQLINGATLAGGYAGVIDPKTDPNTRDIELYETILSGDLNGDDVEVANPCDLLNEPTRTENSYHVVTGNLTDSTAILDGFIITGGNANRQEGYEDNRGGGYFSDSGSPLIRNCMFTGNICLNYGAGMYLSGQCKAVIRDCHIMSNCSADDGGGLFIKNDPGLYDCSPLITGCVIEKNRASDGSGGIRCDDNTEPTIRNCIIAGNTSGEEGGGLSLKWQCSPKIENCTIVANFSEYGGGIYCIETDVRMVNCIMWANRAIHGNQIAMRLLDEEEYRTYTRLSISYCDVQGGKNAVYIDKDCELHWSWSNIDLDPCFAESSYWDPNGTLEDPNDDFWIDGDYHLKSQAGRYDPNSGSWVTDDVTSPCIDAGDPNDPVGDEPEPNGGIINMGAYGGTTEASLSPDPQAHVAYIYTDNTTAADNYKLFLETHKILVTAIDMNDLQQASLSEYDLIIVGNDTGNDEVWGDEQSIAAIENSGRPVLGLGEGGYAFFGKLDLLIGYGRGWHGSQNSIYVVNPDHPVFNTPYPIYVPQDRVLQLYTQTEHIGICIYINVVALGREVSDADHYPLIFEYDRYLLWGFTQSPEKMTDVGKYIFINAVLWMADPDNQAELSAFRTEKSRFY